MVAMSNTHTIVTFNYTKQGAHRPYDAHYADMIHHHHHLFSLTTTYDLSKTGAAKKLARNYQQLQD